MVAGSLYLPKEDKLKPRGEDAHFICREENTIGVADGVGGWAKRGVDAGEYARDLMTYSIIALHNQPKGAVDPKMVLYQAYSNTKAKGSSTACIITLTANVLRAINVGDSGFKVIRGGKIVYQSPIQQSSFNCPYQLGNDIGHPNIAMDLEVAVEAGDIVVAGTDGLLDNMHGSEIEEVINRSMVEGEEDPQQLACSIANLALYNSFDKYTDTPYSLAARKAGHAHRGGKVDDITVIVAFIRKT
ncbi:protein phosphatase 2C family protein [Actinidia rufa]|uniref:Protein phosphatase n=2 Tax=Actinidia rufa TaxID=165716 RepID=A0A7J0FJS6_9ERIC|nr:protein phosphatase 2C family protein [Actinidia rufa]